MALPTYGELIQLLQSAEAEAVACDASLCNLVAAKFRDDFPHISISRPGRFLDTLERIAAPTRPSTIASTGKLDGSPLRSYLKRQWEPRKRNSGMSHNQL